jgi:hypothetical protein
MHGAASLTTFWTAPDRDDEEQRHESELVADVEEQHITGSEGHQDAGMQQHEPTVVLTLAVGDRGP